MSSPISFPSHHEAPTSEITAPITSRSGRILKITGWTGFIVACLLIFTLFKMPDQKIRLYIQGTLAQALATKGIILTAKESSLSYLFGPKFEMRDVVLTLPAPQAPAKIDRITLSPSLLSLLFGKLGGKVKIIAGDGEADIVFKMKRTSDAKASQDFDLDYDLQRFHLGRTGAFMLATDIAGSAIVTGSGHLKGDFNLPSSWQGELQFQFSKINLDAQTIQGFAIPHLSASEATVDLVFENAKANIKTFKLGKTGNTADDLIGQLTGEVVLAQSWATSQTKAKANFSISQNIMKSFVLLDAILGQAKQPDGTFSYELTGPLVALTPNPISPTAAPGGIK